MLPAGVLRTASGFKFVAGIGVGVYGLLFLEFGNNWHYMTKFRYEVFKRIDVMLGLPEPLHLGTRPTAPEKLGEKPDWVEIDILSHLSYKREAERRERSLDDFKRGIEGKEDEKAK